MLQRTGSILTRSSRTRQYYYRNLSMIPDKRRYSIVDITAQRRIGTLGEEFVLVRARRGVHFICRGRVWEIARIGEDGNIYVVPIEDPTAAIPGWHGEILPLPLDVAQEVGRIRDEIEREVKSTRRDHAIETLHRRYPLERLAATPIVDEIQSYLRKGYPVPSDRVILVEGFDRYLIIHTSCGDAVNRTLAFVFDQVLAEQDRVISTWWDGYRILLELPEALSVKNLKAISRELLSMSNRTMEEKFDAYVQRRFPFAYGMKFIAERFGAIPRGLFLNERTLFDMSARFESTPIHEETLRESKLLKVDLDSARKILRSVADGTTKVVSVLSGEEPTPQAFYMLNKLVEVPEMVAPESAKKDSL